MSAIRKLPPEVSGAIAAGEIIERPASVCKELIENSIDAGATHVTVELRDGGKSSIRVDDDGAGIPASELALAVESFATSKIRGVGDIARVATLGFRGEALASIRAVSLLTLRSRTRDAESGRELRLNGAAIERDAPVARTPGTEVVVERLFHNLPARRKFLRSDSSELRRIATLVQGYALAYPATAFTLRDGGVEVLSYPASDAAERAEAVLGAEAFRRCVPIDAPGGSVAASGYSSLPDFTRGNRSLQFFFVNRRQVRDRVLSHAAMQAYHSLIPTDRHPVVVLFLEVPPDEVDVNVHPAKAEIRFRNEGEIHRFVLGALRSSLEGKGTGLRERVESAYRGIFPVPREWGGATAGEQQAEPLFAATGWPAMEGTFPPFSDAAGSAGAHEAPLSLFGDESARPAVTGGALYWQLHQSYILIQIRSGMVIIDQHAAHERILYNRAKAALAGGGAAVQSLLFPATLELSSDEYERFEELASVMPSLGFDIEPFGLRSIIVRGIPAGVKNWADGALIEEILGEAEEERSLEGFLKAYACHSAVKAGMRLGPEEMESLADELFATDYPYTCPHGRPTMLRVNLDELERRFQRTVSRKR